MVIDEKVREDKLRALGWIVVRWVWDQLAMPRLIVESARTAAQLATPFKQSGFWRPRVKP